MPLNLITEILGITDREERRAALEATLSTITIHPEEPRPIDLHACRIPNGWTIIDGCIYTQDWHFFGYTTGWQDAWRRRIINRGNEPPELRIIEHPNDNKIWAYREPKGPRT